MFRFAAVGLLVGAATMPAHAQGYHLNNGYYNHYGTYVQPHYQTNPNGNPYDNWSSRPNVNPFTFQPGTRNPW